MLREISKTGKSKYSLSHLDMESKKSPPLPPRPLSTKRRSDLWWKEGKLNKGSKILESSSYKMHKVLGM